MNKYTFLIFIFSQVLFSQNKITTESEFSSSWARPSLSIIFVEFTPDIKNYDPPGEVNLDDLKESFNELKESFSGLFSKNPSSSGTLKVLNVNTPKSFMNDFDIFNLNIKEENIRINKNQNYFDVVSSLYADDLVSSVFYLNENSVIVLDDIYWSDGMLNAWKQLIQHTAVTYSVDIYSSGFLFFNKSMKSKQHFALIENWKKIWQVGLFSKIKK